MIVCFISLLASPLTVSKAEMWSSLPKEKYKPGKLLQDFVLVIKHVTKQVSENTFLAHDLSRGGSLSC